MVAWWIPLALSAATSLIKKEGSPAAQATSAADIAASQFATAAAGQSIDPTSPNFRNLASLFRDQEFADSLKGVNAIRRLKLRQQARGAPVSFGTDRDISAVLAEAFRSAGFSGQARAQQSLLSAAGAAKGTGTGGAAIIEAGRVAQANQGRLGDIAELLRGTNLFSRPNTAAIPSTTFAGGISSDTGFDAGGFDPIDLGSGVFN